MKKENSKLVGYMRVSTDEQEFDLQRSALIKYGVEPDIIFHDKMSGKTMNRAGLKRAIKVCWPGDTLVVWKLDRLGRSLVGVIEQIEALHKAGVNIVSITENIDYDSPMGRAMMGVTLVFAQMERELISERTKAGIAEYIAKGGVMGQPHPILGRPKRRDKFKALYDTGALFRMTGQQVVDAMNAADPKLKPMSTASWFNTKDRTIGEFLPKDEPISKGDSDE